MTSDSFEYARSNRRRFVQELASFISFPSVSTQSAYAGDVRHCADWLADHLRRVGLSNVAIWRTKRHPIVCAGWKKAQGLPTILIYGHYDVQPAEPFNQWRSPPFKPVIVGNKIYGRGAADDKGQLFTHIKALESLLRTSGSLPVNVQCIFEGEEEIGSPSLNSFVMRHKRSLAADIAVLSDTRMLAPGRPAIIYSLRGALTLQLDVRVGRSDLHAGNFGGAIQNPLQALSEIVAGLHDVAGRVAVPGFYDRVRPVSEQERNFMAETGPSDVKMLAEAQASTPWGEPGYTLYERTTIRPAVTLNGISGGYQGPGQKAIIPNAAYVKINIRLVPDQDPHEIFRLVRAYVADLTPPGLNSVVRFMSAAAPVVLDRSHPAMQAASNAYLKGFGRTPVFLRSGGTIPAVNTFHMVLGVPSVLMGFALPEDRIHAANEGFDVRRFFNGIATSMWFLKEMAALGPKPVFGSTGANWTSSSPPGRLIDLRP
jgi:acetylornithine deacetylase/succinyl-diaminopimelate desuccinylase-like protein